MEGTTKYACWLEILDDTVDEDDEDAEEVIWRFKVMGTLTDVQAAIARAALELEENQSLSVTVEAFHADAD